MSRALVRYLALVLASSLVSLVTAADWPMWRYDAGRTAASPDSLPDRLQLRWVRALPPLRPAWPDQPMMQFDAAYEPIAADARLYVGSSRTDSVTAYDAATGREAWRFDADAPVRLPPVAWRGRVYFVADDGCLYCVEGASGKLVWKFEGGPYERRILGNERLISTWPARGGPVIADGHVYFSAGIWPFLGIFLHAIDAETGDDHWTNDGDGSLFIKQPHNADSFAGVAPQGAFAVNGDKLLIPGGRSVPACYDRQTGKLLHYLLADNGKRGGGSNVATVSGLYVNGNAVFDLATGKFQGAFTGLTVLTPQHVYQAAGSKCRELEVAAAEVTLVETLDSAGKKSKTPTWTARETGAVDFAGATAFIKAGSRLYVGAKDRLAAFDLPLASGAAPAWTAEFVGTPASLLAANGRLFVVTREGRIGCFSANETDAAETFDAPPNTATGAALNGAASWKKFVQTTVKKTGTREGYAIAWGAGSGDLVAELIRQTKLHVIVVERDAERAAALRERLVAAGQYGVRGSVHHADPATIALPPYLASLMVSEDPAAAFGTAPDGRVPDGPAGKVLAKAFASLRPFGGTFVWPSDDERNEAWKKAFDAAQASPQTGLAGAELTFADGLARLSRPDAIPGTANWTHEHADAANTRVSQDTVVRAPLGVLWFGGSTNDRVLPRHGHGPQPQVIDGRLIVEGPDMLRAMDLYSGRVLWETALLGLGKFYDNTAHQPGANAAGTNYISTADGIYVAHNAECLRLDPATGKVVSRFKVPDASGTRRWAYINVAGDFLIGTSDPLLTPIRPTGVSLLDKLAKYENDSLSSSRHLFVLHRHTGQLLWQATARDGWRHNAICAGGGRLYCVDRLSGLQLGRLKRMGEEPKTKPRLVVFDLDTGREEWSTEHDIFGTWLSYSEKHDLLIEAGRRARDTISDEPVGMRVYRAAGGKAGPEIVWENKSLAGPTMLHGDTVLLDGKACELLTGQAVKRTDPLTLEPVEWTWSRSYGCNTPAASLNLLTFRSGAAGYFDLTRDGGTGNFGGFRSSCTNNLIVAGGVLAAPDYTRTCTCGYQNQTSLALVHMPEAEMWTFFDSKTSKAPVRRVGVNLGAPGDRRADDGTLWLEFPSTGGRSPVIEIKTQPDKPRWFRRHAAQIEGPGLPWVAGSGAIGLTSLRLRVATDSPSPRPYTVKLHFAEPEELAPGQRVFDVALQGRPVLERFDIVKEAGDDLHGLVKTFSGVQVQDVLEVTCTGRTSAPPVLCGIELKAE